MKAEDINIAPNWRRVLKSSLESESFELLAQRIKNERKLGKTIYPSGPNIFKAFELCSFEKLKVVILGQDPYHGPGQAMGLSFSVPRTIRIPPSLLNIYKELNRDYAYKIPNHGDLTEWANQGVLLLNAVLTVEAGMAGSHRNFGWMAFTDAVIQTISEKKAHVVFLLWGNFARKKKTLINHQKHLILESAHPSPLAGNRFQGNGHFSKTNEYLSKHNLDEINWQIT